MKRDRKLSEIVVQTVRDPLLVLDGSLRVEMANRAFYQVFHAAPESTESKPIFELDGGRWDIPELRRDLEAMLRHNIEAAELEVECDLPQGRRAIVMSARPFRHEDGQNSRILLTLRDITDRKKRESALRESELRLAALMDNTPTVAFMRDESGKYVYVNRAFEAVTGKRASEVIGRTPFDVWPAEVAAALLEHDRMVLAKGEPMEITEKTAVSDGASREWLAVKFPFRDGEDRRLVGSVSVDITERRRLEEQLRKAQKMEAVGRLAGGLAHDFNNLLTIIDGYAQLLLEDSSLSSAQQSQAREILKAGERAAELTRQLLAFSRQQPLAPVILDMNSVVRGVENMLKRLIGENIDLRAALAANLYAVKADRVQMEQVLLNLSVNARDAMPEGGSLTIETSNIALDELYVLAHPLVPPGDYVLIAVSDTGVGMDRQTQAHIFEPFFTTKEPGKGTGLGLATVYGIVKQSGGFIWLYSEVGRGTTFKIYLPRAEGEAGPHRVKLLRAEARSGTETILLVEDDAGVRELAAQILQARGYKLLVASDPEEAFKLFDRHPDPIHLLLTDVVMPKASGHELAGRLLALRPAMKVLYMSGYTEGAVVRQGIIAEGAHLLQKPFSPDELLRTVRDLLDH